ncbi:MAG: hypothetical protein GX022_03020 [Clostridiaceae bacterium]|nr:hypothetical protein [Clostridiaceae bacterium]
MICLTVILNAAKRNEESFRFFADAQNDKRGIILCEAQQRTDARFLIEISRSVSKERPPSGNLIKNV